MNKTAQTVLLLCGLAYGTANADLTLTNQTHTSTNINSRETFFILANATGLDNIFIQSFASTTSGFNDGATFMDGLLSVWQQIGSNWSLIALNDSAPRIDAATTNSSPTSTFGQTALGYVAPTCLPVAPFTCDTNFEKGLMDPGLSVNLTAGSTYMIVQSAGGPAGFNDAPSLTIGQTTPINTNLKTVFNGQDDQSGGAGTPYSYTNKYNLTVTGNVSQTTAPVSPVTVPAEPLPGAALLFGAIMLGFEWMKRKQANVDLPFVN